MQQRFILVGAVAGVALMGQACVPWGAEKGASLPVVAPPGAFDQDVTMDEKKADDGMMKQDEASAEIKAEAMVEQAGAMADKKEDTGMMKKDGSEAKAMPKPVPYYIAYTAGEAAKAQAAGKVTLLYFYAAWCPICQAEEPNIKAAVESSGLNVAGFRVDYDTEAELKTKFKIPYQHTTVVLNPSGIESARFSGPVEAATLQAALKQASES